ncbi:MAG TPA: hypothetical protein VG365_00175 [Solirubrobacteraceae bacterium]|jgi:hypothetical protein|nr:hypothetical protein [Solirubrobacteraceae bacterium]
MRREEADAERERLKQDDQEHTYFVREQVAGEWEVVRTNIPCPTSDVVAERGEPADVPDFRPSSIRQIPPIGPGF